MTDREALLCAVCESPEDDLPRLVMADFLEERGEAERAAFIRVQCELARLTPLCTIAESVHRGVSIAALQRTLGIDKLRRHERELLGPMVGGTNMRETEAKWLEGSPLLDGREIAGGGWMRAVEVEWCRGFIDSIQCSWSDFLRVERSLIWNASATDECPKCKEHGTRDWPDTDPSGACVHCGGKNDEEGRLLHRGSGRIPRPFAATCQPIRRVRFTGPYQLNPQERNWTSDWIRLPTEDGEGVRFDRVKCEACSGHGNIHQYQCPKCRGEPINSWHCAAWPRVTFEMPVEADDNRERTIAERFEDARNTMVRDIVRGLGVPPSLLNR